MKTYLCFKDENDVYGYIPPDTPYTVKRISTTQIQIETGFLSANVDVGSGCDYSSTVLGFVTKEENAMKWVLCGDNDSFIGKKNCPVPTPEE